VEVSERSNSGGSYPLGFILKCKRGRGDYLNQDKRKEKSLLHGYTSQTEPNKALTRKGSVYFVDGPSCLGRLRYVPRGDSRGDRQLGSKPLKIGVS